MNEWYQDFVLGVKAIAGSLVAIFEPHAIGWCALGFALAHFINWNIKLYVKRKA